jgi:hypothetical protein
VNVSIAAHSYELNVYRVFAITFPVGFAQIIDGHVSCPRGDGDELKPVRSDLKFGLRPWARSYIVRLGNKSHVKMVFVTRRFWETFQTVATIDLNFMYMDYRIIIIIIKESL